MALLSSGASGIIRPEDVGDLVVKPVERESVALTISNVVHTNSPSFRIPIITADSSAAWTPEGTEITATAPGVAELVVRPVKLGALTVVSNELANDSSPEAQQIVGDSIARDLARKIDAAYFTATTPNGPSGIESVGYQLVSAGSAFTDLDAFSEAISKAETVGAQVTSWVTHPQTLFELSKLKSSPGRMNHSCNPIRLCRHAGRYSESQSTGPRSSMKARCGRSPRPVSSP